MNANTATASEGNMKEAQNHIHDLRAQIAAHPFARGLNQEQVAILADCAMETQFAPGELIFREGEFANRFYFLLEGEVALESPAKGKPVAIESIGAGDVLGWSWLFPPYDWHFSARAVKPTRAIFFYGTWLREHCEQNCDLGYELIKRMAEVMIRRLQATRRRLGTALAGKSEGNETIKNNSERYDERR